MKHAHTLFAKSVHGLFVEGDQEMWKRDDPGEVAIPPDASEDYRRTLQVQSRTQLTLGRAGLRGNDPSAEERLTGIVGAVRGFESSDQACPSAHEAGASATDWALHLIIRFNRDEGSARRPGFRRVIRLPGRGFREEFIDTCYTFGGAGEPRTYKDTPEDQSAALLERIHDPSQDVVQALVTDSLNLRIWPHPTDIAFSVDDVVAREMYALWEQGLALLPDQA